MLSYLTRKQKSEPGDGDNALSAAILLVLGRLSLQSGDLLNILSFFNPNYIPVDMLHNGAVRAFTVTCSGQDGRPLDPWHTPIKELFEVLKMPTDLHRALGKLQSLSVIEKPLCEGDTVPFIRFHPLCGIPSSSWLYPDELPYWIEAAATIVLGALEKGLEEAGGKICARSYRLRPHVLSVLKHMKTDPIREYQPFFSHILAELGAFLRSFCDYSEALDMFQLAAFASTNDRNIGPNDPYTLHLQEQHANLCVNLGQYETAVTIHSEVLQKRKKLLGCFHPDTIRAYCNIATLSAARGRYEESAKSFRWAELLMRCLSMKRMCPRPFELSYIPEGLALALWRLGQDRKAQRLLEGALRYGRRP